jgi:hypothetical protein
MYETFGYMSDLIVHASQHSDLTVEQALSSIVDMNRSSQGQARPQNAAMLQMQQAMNRLPNGAMIGQQGGPEGYMAMSPAMHAGLLAQANGSPHLGGPMGMVQSPVPSHMAPPMAAQQSQQGSASGPSTNASPNMPNKRRRSTAQVKAEDGSEINGTTGKKVKPSPQMNKRAKQS